MSTPREDSLLGNANRAKEDGNAGAGYRYTEWIAQYYKWFWQTCRDHK